MNPARHEKQIHLSVQTTSVTCNDSDPHDRSTSALPYDL